MSYSFPPFTYEVLTPRLVIRNAIPSDAEELACILSSPENMPYQKVDVNLSIDDMLRRIANWNRMASEGTNAFLVIALRNSGEVIGNGGFNCFEPQSDCYDMPTSEPNIGDHGTNLQPGNSDKPTSDKCPHLTDIGIMLDIRFWRKGYATEALCALIDFAFTQLKCQLIRFETNIENEPWRALMRSMGFQDLEEKGAVSYDGTTGWLYKADVDVWETAKTGLKGSRKWPLCHNL